MGFLKGLMERIIQFLTPMSMRIYSVGMDMKILFKSTHMDIMSWNLTFPTLLFKAQPRAFKKWTLLSRSISYEQRMLFCNQMHGRAVPLINSETIATL